MALPTVNQPAYRPARFGPHGIYRAGDSGLTETQFRQKQAQAGPIGELDPFGQRGPANGRANDPAGSLPGVYSPGPAIVNQPGQYANAGATNNLSQPMTWQADPNLQKISGAMTQMLGFGNGPSGFDTSSGSLLGGPGQGLSKAELGGLYATGAGNLRQNQQNATQGASMAAAGRGTTGVPMSALMNPAAQSANRGALAQADLDARMKGYDLGTQQYAQRASTFGNLLSGANAESNRSLQTQVSDATSRQQSRQQGADMAKESMNDMANFANNHLMELTTNPGGKNGKSTMMNSRAVMEHFANIFKQYSGNYNQFAM